MSIIAAVVATIICFAPVAEPVDLAPQAQAFQQAMLVQMEEQLDPANQYTQEEISILCRITAAESRGECDLGQKAVVNVILNRVNSGRFSSTISGVVFAPGQFTPARKSSFANVKYDDRVEANVMSVLRGERVIPDNVMYFNGSAGLPRNLYQKIGNHNFYY